MASDDGIVAFILARLDEDEAAAKAAAEDSSAGWFTVEDGWDRDERSVMYTGPSTLRPGDIWDYPVAKKLTISNAKHVARHDPARVLREAEAGRVIVRMRAEIDRYSEWDAVTLDAVIEHLATVYSDHPDYRPEWKP